MNETSQICDRKDPLANVPAVSIAPPPRCFHREGSSPGFPCGKLARWKRAGNHWFADEYFCDEHRAPADLELGKVIPFRRVRVNVDVYISGVHVNLAIAQAEAVHQLELGLQSIGAVGDVVTVTSSMVKSVGLPPPLPRNVRTVDPE